MSHPAAHAIRIRPETPDDEHRIFEVVERAFGRPDEAGLVDALRLSSRWRLSLVAALDADVVGHVLFTPVTIGAADVRAVGLAPLAVAPEYQNAGVGSRLVTEGLAACARAGRVLAVVLGHPSYYPRFGFRPASQFGLTCEFAVPHDTFMAVQLDPSARLPAGLVRYAPEFSTF